MRTCCSKVDFKHFVSSASKFLWWNTRNGHSCLYVAALCFTTLSCSLREASVMWTIVNACVRQEGPMWHQPICISMMTSTVIRSWWGPSDVQRYQASGFADKSWLIFSIALQAESCIDPSSFVLVWPSICLYIFECTSHVLNKHCRILLSHAIRDERWDTIGAEWQQVQNQNLLSKARSWQLIPQVRLLSPQCMTGRLVRHTSALWNAWGKPCPLHATLVLTIGSDLGKFDLVRFHPLHVCNFHVMHMFLLGSLYFLLL